MTAIYFEYPRLALPAVEQIAYRLPTRLVHVAISGTQATGRRRIRRFRLAALGATVGKSGLARLQFKLFSANRADFNRKRYSNSIVKETLHRSVGSRNLNI